MWGENAMALERLDKLLSSTGRWSRKEVKELDPMQFKQLMKNPIVMDGRNCYPPEKMKQLGIVYESIGRPE